MGQWYWVVQDQFLAGEYPRDLDEGSSREKLDALIQLGVSAFVDLTEESDGLKPYLHLLEPYKSKGVSYQRFPIRDVSVPDPTAATIAILDAIDDHIRKGRAVYVHCWGGVGRTGVIVGCWLARHGYHGKSALVRLRDLWRHCPKSTMRTTPETVQQEKYIVDWNESR